MSPQAKYNTKWLLTSLGAVFALFVGVVTSTAKITTEFNQVDARFNENDIAHQAIITTAELDRKIQAEETARSKLNDAAEHNARVISDRRQAEMQKDIEYLVESFDEFKRNQ